MGALRTPRSRLAGARPPGFLLLELAVAALLFISAEEEDEEEQDPTEKADLQELLDKGELAVAAA